MSAADTTLRLPAWARKAGPLPRGVRAGVFARSSFDPEEVYRSGGAR